MATATPVATIATWGYIGLQCRVKVGITAASARSAHSADGGLASAADPPGAAAFLARRKRTASRCGTSRTTIIPSDIPPCAAGTAVATLGR